ncbi:ATP-dependent RNA helicase vasa-like isoform X2 [Artemia franciscana]|uniref:RNA helicase n=1 Tax=Artemia franciscana TaxID=6661 RepID=A0AA88H8M6_ARTSF|nr:hypothetical protein QYM36_016674 [Artemia franciscana]KAK2704361.1 hypothetical protein QYM36_016674 [Artemia franciscana]
MDDWDDEEKPTTYVKGNALESTTQDNGWNPVESGGWNDSGAKESNGWDESNNNSWGRSNGDSGFQGSGRGGRGEGSSGKCFNCNQEGHMSRECTQPRAERGGGRGGGRGGSRACYNCNQEGHMSQECTEPRAERGGGRGGGRGGSRACFNCQQEGHRASDCTEPRAERGRGGGRGRGGRGGFGRTETTTSDWGDNGTDTAAESGWNGDSFAESDNFGNDTSSGFRGRGGRGGRGRGGGRGPSDDSEPAGETTEPERAPVTYIPDEEEETEELLFHRGTTAGINFSKFSNVAAKVTGEDLPSGIDSFDAAGLRPKILDNIKKSGYTQPTPVQKWAIPVIMKKRDLMACAQTGSGKTGAYLIPIINRLIEEGCAASSYDETQTPEAVVMCPTRELAIQIFKEAVKFSYDTIIKPVVVYGGVAPRYQSDKVKSGCNILVGTPGRLIDFMNRGVFNFSACKFLVLDEADRMLDMGFMGEVKKVVYHGTMPVKVERNTLMFSATFPNEVQELAAEFLENYIFVTVGTVGGACTDVLQEVIEIDAKSRIDRLLEILTEKEGVKTLVFASSKKTADFLAALLSTKNLPATSIHGDRFQYQREEALRDFKSGHRNILVATAVAARGLDIKGVGLVINYELPTDIDEYVHRIGRTGRLGNTGHAISFFNPDKDSAIAGKLVNVLAAAQQTVPVFLESMASGVSFGSDASSRFGGSDVRNTGRALEVQIEADEEWS